MFIRSHRPYEFCIVWLFQAPAALTLHLLFCLSSTFRLFPVPAFGMMIIQLICVTLPCSSEHILAFSVMYCFVFSLSCSPALLHSKQRQGLTRVVFFLFFSARSWLNSFDSLIFTSDAFLMEIFFFLLVYTSLAFLHHCKPWSHCVALKAVILSALLPLNSRPFSLVLRSILITMSFFRHSILRFPVVLVLKI